MDNFANYTFVHEQFFEPLGRCPVEGHYKDIIEEFVSDPWRVSREGIWCSVFRDGMKVPDQGFKIHLSGTPLNAETVLKRSAPVLLKYDCSFKFVAGERLIKFINSKNYARGGSSKFITAYPEPDNFKLLCQELDNRMSDLDSPYILSDRQYSEGSIVFYRYGGFKPRSKTRVDGTQVPVIRKPDGDFVEDRRTPYFQLPTWVNDPFGRSGEVQKRDNNYLKERYKIEGAFQFSNTGGVYKAEDTESGNTVVIKEARPLTNVWADGETSIDAVDIIENEYRVLQRLSEVGAVPSAIDIFTEWKHRFLVQEHREGTPLTRYRAQDKVSLAPYVAEHANVEAFCEAFHLIAKRLIQIIKRVHEHDVIIGDFSPSNVLVGDAPDDLNIIDFESAVEIHDSLSPSLPEQYVSRWSTPGFRSEERLQNNSIQFSDDFHALAVTLFSTILPCQPIFELDREAGNRVLEGIEVATGLPSPVRGTIEALMEGNPDAALDVLEELGEANTDRESLRTPPAKPKDTLDNLIGRNIERIGTFISETINLDRDDRITPSDVRLYQTNPLSFAYGASGVALFLDVINHSAANQVVEWIIDQAERISELPPGLYIGSSGIAVALLNMGYTDAAEEMLRRATMSPLRFEASNLFYGAAGWGLACLRFHHEDEASWALKQAEEAAEYLLDTGSISDAGRYWGSDNPSDATLGVAHGASGIALFLLYVAEATGSTEYLDAAREALEFELHFARDDGTILEIGREPNWDTKEPYWLHGAAGLGSVLVRFAKYLDEEMYRKKARRAARGAFTRFTVGPWQLEGLCGIGEFMLDLHYVTGDAEAIDRAYTIADSVLRYRIDTTAGVAYPGRQLVRLSNDFGTGAAGIGLFLDRLLTCRRRPLHDVFEPLHQTTGEITEVALAS